MKTVLLILASILYPTALCANEAKPVTKKAPAVTPNAGVSGFYHALLVHHPTKTIQTSNSSKSVKSSLYQKIGLGFLLTSSKHPRTRLDLGLSIFAHPGSNELSNLENQHTQNSSPSVYKAYLDHLVNGFLVLNIGRFQDFNSKMSENSPLYALALSLSPISQEGLRASVKILGISTSLSILTNHTWEIKEHIGLVAFGMNQSVVGSKDDNYIVHSKQALGTAKGVTVSKNFGRVNVSVDYLSYFKSYRYLMFLNFKNDHLRLEVSRKFEIRHIANRVEFFEDYDLETSSYQGHLAFLSLFSPFFEFERSKASSQSELLQANNLSVNSNSVGLEYSASGGFTPMLAYKRERAEYSDDSEKALTTPYWLFGISGGL